MKNYLNKIIIILLISSPAFGQIGVNTLTAMAYGFVTAESGNIREEDLLCPMIDARRMEVYSAIYNPQLAVILPTGARIIDETTFDNLTDVSRILLFGSGADKLETMFAGHSTVRVIPGAKNSARYLSLLAYEALQAGDFVNVAYFEPNYLKDFVASTPKKKAL